MIARESYYTALFAQLETLSAVNGGPCSIVSRTPKPGEEHSPAELPAVYMLVSHQPTKQDDGAPPIHELQAVLIVHAIRNDHHISGGVAINALLDAIEAAIGVDNWAFGANTLGGIAQHCRIEGKIEIYEGVDGSRASAIVPVSILVP